eukprot:scaffold34128_cov22-Tisochrysis_lutea.AAC.1
MHMHIHTHVHRGCKRLLLYGARVNSCDAFGRSPLHVVLENGRTKVASFLLDQGANRNLQDGLPACLEAQCAPFACSQMYVSEFAFAKVS